MKFSLSLILLFLSASLPASVTFKKNIPYCQTRSGSIFLDLYQPDGSNLPVIVFLHGGGWAYGSKDGFHEQLLMTANKKFVAIAINYRLVREENNVVIDPYPAPLEDVKCALAWIKKEGRSHGIDPNRIGLAGESAGAHLALMAGLTNPTLIKGILNLYGPTEITSLYDEGPKLRDLILLTFGQERGGIQWVAGSPVNFMKKDSPPILTIHGTIDDVVPYHQAEILHRESIKVSARHQLITRPLEGHGLNKESRNRAFEEGLQFFKRLMP